MFERKKKKKFVSLPFKIEEVVVKNSTHLLELFQPLKSLYLKEVKPIYGFDLQGLCFQHLVLVRYGNLFIKIRDGRGDNEVENSREKRKKKLYKMMI